MHIEGSNIPVLFCKSLQRAARSEFCLRPLGGKSTFKVPANHDDQFKGRPVAFRNNIPKGLFFGKQLLPLLVDLPLDFKLNLA